MTLAPSSWPADERARWFALQAKRKPGHPTATGRHGIVTTAHNALATRVGIEALKQGGSAVDATLAAALAQITLGAGAVISFFGIFGLVHYEAKTGDVTSLSAGWKTVKGETDPATIPGRMGGMRTAEEVLISGGGSEPSGRTAWVGGFLRAVETAHRRFGKLSWQALFEPAIELAEEGFTVGEELHYYIALRGDGLRRLPETAAIFVKPDGTLYRQGDHFRQPALAATLKGVAEHGVDWMYRGDWARKAAAAVQREGGHMTEADIASYEAPWSEPVRVARGGFDIALLGGTSAAWGSTQVIEALHLADAAGLKAKGHWSSSPESFCTINALVNGAMISMLPPEHRPAALRDADFSADARRTPEHASALWGLLDPPAPGPAATPAGTKSDTVTVIDAAGNIAALCHSSNCMCWGATSLIVDGISIHDPGSHSSAIAVGVAPGDYLPLPIEVGVMLKDGVGVVGFASKNMGLHQKTVQCLLNMTDYGMDAVGAANAPALGLPAYDADGPKPRVVEGDFPDAVLKGSGLPVEVAKKDDAWIAEGHWVPAERDPATGLMTATSPEHASGQAASL